MASSIFKTQTEYDRAWWREVIIYQVYVHSFKDSNGDGIGDLRGATEKVPYLKSLGIDVIWLTPVYESPLKDMGYDISDYERINPIYGTLEDWQELLDELHKRDMRLIMDLVVNHTSDQHAWFKESRSSRDNPKHDWYHWMDPKYDDQGNRKPPNNWASVFGGPAWTWGEERQQYYLRLFASEQPDLNWTKPEVRNAIYKMMRFWLDLGIDGFRMDVINMISKVHGLPDAPVTGPGDVQNGGSMFLNEPNVHKYLKEMHKEVLAGRNVLTVGEMPGGVDPYEASKYVALERKELHMIFQFAHMTLDGTNGDKWEIREWTLPELKDSIRVWQQHMIGNHGWNSIFLENHDQPRAVNHFGNADPKYRDKCAKMIAMFQLSLRGSIYIYQGQEIGAAAPTDWNIEDYQDVETLNWYNAKVEEKKAKGEEPDYDKLMSLVRRVSRDNARAPMQWSRGANAGFCKDDAKPWLRVNNEYKEGWNVEDEMKNPDSVWNFYKKLIFFRKTHPPFFYGGFTLIDEEDPKVFAYVRTQHEFGYLIVLNWTKEENEWEVPEEIPVPGGILALSNYDMDPLTQLTQRLKLQPYEGRVYALRPGFGSVGHG
ncbi:hypothetical protein H2201_004379 [Coniosporium apollinis]|uniref:Glycosyl hydrolase family 13 catalytic domain-containing protein n=2 Tax=Coniosporium TaxID=2810619 RepID=A0ABQ9NZF0_9PEZI|nr:hypothetical protein H2199_004059 [Cladosporium sp. JES 115]KAJ9665497.1 hypothetical protein H2201_004379 [Coniosporium apollinis]